MAGAHLDSWVAARRRGRQCRRQRGGDGGGAHPRAIGVRPKRTIRFALWTGEEQGLLGSLAYVEHHLATPPARDRPGPARLRATRPGATAGRSRRCPAIGDLAAYFNLDNGSGKIRGIYAEGNVAAVPIFQEWLAPFASMGATTVVDPHRPAAPTMSIMQAVGIPGFQFIQDPLDYGSRLHHTSLDTLRPPEGRGPAPGRGHPGERSCSTPPIATSRCRACRCRPSRGRATRSTIPPED